MKVEITQTRFNAVRHIGPNVSIGLFSGPFERALFLYLFYELASYNWAASLLKFT